MRNRKFLSGLILCLAAGFGTTASAGLVGTVVSQCADSAFVGAVTADATLCDGGTAQPTPGSAVIGAGVEFSLTNSGTRTFDFSDNMLSIFYDNVDSASPDLYVFDFELAIESVVLVSSNILGVTWTTLGDSLGILVSSPLQNGRVDLALNTASVPEPASFALFGLGLAGLGFTRRKKSA